MTTPSDELLARRLAPAPADLELPLSDDEALVSLAAVSTALARRRASRVRPIVIGLSVAAAAVIGLVAAAVALRPREGARVVDTGDAVELATARPFATGDRLAVGQRVKTGAQGRLTVEFEDRTTVMLSARGDLALRRVGPVRELELVAGRLEASVTKLGAAERFIVKTARAAVEVRGTRFVIESTVASPSCRDGALRVEVLEGSVLVDEQALEAGETFTLPCEPVVAPVEPTPVREPTARPRRRVEPSSLARMNAMYQRAQSLKRDGRLGEAAGVFRELRATFPGGPLAEAAAVEELRLLERLGSPAAADAARDYLREFPEGYAREAAEQLVAP